ncbi:MAG: outer membrane beta-barrel domain-containing protein [Myxococcota bacterium]
MLKNRFCRFLASVLCCGAIVLALQEPAAAQETRQEFDDTIHVVQRKPVLQKGRLDLVPRIGLTFNDTIYRTMKVGVNANYHIAENLYVGGLFEWYDFGDALGGRTQTFKSIQNETSVAADAPVINWLGGLELGYKPIVGKFALFNSGILFYDLGVTLGGTYVNSQSVSIQNASGGPGATISMVGRVFLNDWMAINLEIRDVIFSADLLGASGTIANVASVSGGVSLYLPTSFEYSDQAAEDEE